VATLAETTARLEHAHSLVELGAALRRTGDRWAAREPLRAGLELAHRCGALPLDERARIELAASGARPRKAVRSGVEALTPSELRVARLAAGGRTNREIAQELFVTVKTVEFHLRHCYQKLDIARRNELADALS
jgi:DNA-binding CsgD family transcriptional regulator